MLRRFLLTIGLAALFLAACQPQATPPPLSTAFAPTLAPTPTSAPDLAPAPPLHADAIRFALVGDATLSNVWAYYDEPGADYNNRAVQDGFWPSLFRLSPLTGAFEPYLSDGTISPLEPDSGFFASNVTLRPGLLWSDGTPLAAQDVAFTVNAALDFRLGLDWLDYYDPAVIYRAEALDAQTVRFYFRVQPSIANWQYGALQGPIVNAAYWEPKLAGAYAALLPNPELDRAIHNLQEEVARLQRELDDLLYELGLLNASSAAYQELLTKIYDKQEEIDGVQNAINEKLEEKEVVFAAARQILYSLDSVGEPTFGPFIPSRRAAGEFENAANPLYPFGLPNFDRAVYRLYPDEASALDALSRGEVNVVLKQDGVANPEAGSFQLSGDITPTMPRFPRRNLRLLTFNLRNPALSETTLRQAVACMATLHFSPTTAYFPDNLILAPTEFGFTRASP
ncbi:MAG: ABC transporter substrate-binding protein, partial [Chloroflexota bacterium]